MKAEAYCEISAPFGPVERDQRSGEFSSLIHPWPGLALPLRVHFVV